jgi:hypothetical protein
LYCRFERRNHGALWSTCANYFRRYLDSYLIVGLTLFYSPSEAKTTGRAR